MADKVSVKSADDIIKDFEKHKTNKDELSKAGDLELSLDDIMELCRTAKPILHAEQTLLDIEPAVTIAGDIHGQFADLFRLFQAGGFPPETKYLFLGDYVDRGPKSIETIVILLSYKIRYPDVFFLLRGNHETLTVNRRYGFSEECRRRYGMADGILIYESLNSVFDYMSLAAVIGGKIFCCHGGLSPELDNVDQIKAITKPIAVPRTGLICDLLWADPSDEVETWGPSDRRISYVFGEKAIRTFLEKNNMIRIIRAHEAVDGHRIFNEDLFTVFSAPNHCGEMNNASLVLIDVDLQHKFITIPPENRFNNMNCVSRSLYRYFINQNNLQNCCKKFICGSSNSKS